VYKEKGELSRRAISGIMLTILLIGMLTLAFNIQPVKADEIPEIPPPPGVHNLNTGLSYVTIQEAIDASETLDGHTIKVDAGTYFERVTVYKSLNLIGQNRSATIIDGFDGRYSPIVYVTANKVNISEFTIQSSRLVHYETGWIGVVFGFANHSSLGNNIIVNNYLGVVLSGSSENSISGNNITGNHVGIFLEYTHLNESTNNMITNNMILNNIYGVGIEECSGNTIYHNNFIDNIIQVSVSLPHINTWDGGYPFGGNYWSDYGGTDLFWGPCQNETGKDGIGDSPYLIDTNNQDRYPLLTPFGQPSTLYVPTRYKTIQEAINMASTGDTIFVSSGTYYENVIVNKTLALAGEDRETTIIDANGTGTAIEVRANNVNISGFTIKNSEYYGIYLNNAIYCNISKNIINRNWEPIRLYWSSANIISRNDITNNSNGAGLYWSLNNIISDNNITDNGNDGIHIFRFSNYNKISGNNIANNNEGIHLIDSSNNRISGNNIANNYYEGIGLASSSNNTISSNNISNNGYGKPPFLPEFEGYGIWLSNSANNTIYHNNFINNTNQVWSSYSTNTWDYGYPSGGNHWNDYTGNDSNSDGIGDTPYVIDVDNQDRYPLMHPWSSLPVHNINTGLGYATIQEAINANETLNGHAIFVETGTYYENVVVNKTISLIGENKEATIIDGCATGTVVVRAEMTKLTISNFTVRGSGPGWPGIMIYSASYCNVSNNNIVDNDDGLSLFGSSNNEIYGNDIMTNRWSGIAGDYVSNNNIHNNNIANNQYGVLLGHSLNNTIYRNNIANNVGGVGLYSSSGNTIYVNNLTANSNYGIRFEYSSNNIIYHNNFTNNTYQVESILSVNTYDDGYPSGGNYWSDYVGVDVKSSAKQDLPGSDGMGDTPYEIDVNNRDRYPLMNPYGAPPPPTYILTITATVGGTTDPALGTYSYTANSTVQVTAIPAANYLFDYWELDGVNVGSANPYTVLMDKNHTLKAFFSPIPPPLSASISPLSASILVGQSVTFTSTVSGGYTPYSYQWYLNGNPISGATSNAWAFTPTTSGIYYAHLKVTDAKGNTAQSDTARIVVSTVPVGGYSIPIQTPATAKPLTPYLILTAILTIAFTTIKHKTTKKTKKPQ
jgi:parallel beta-helix repeat protein